MDVADRTGHETEEGDDTSNTMQEKVSAQDNSSHDESRARQDTGIMSTVTGAVDVEVGALADQIAQVKAGMVATQVTPSGQGIKQVFTPHFYRRLPHPLSHLLKELPVVDGTDGNLLCDFLLKVIKIIHVGQMNESATYELMYRYCRDELLGLVTQAINTRETFEDFHVRSLGHFIPSREMPQLRIARYERVQSVGEQFSNYVQAIKDAALVLRINKSEEQVVERAVEGLTPTQRARFVFQSPPSSFRQLERLAIVDRNIAYADRSRAEPAPEVTIAVVESPTGHGEPGESGSKRAQESSQRKAVVCFYCRRPGHKQRRCFRRMSQRGKIAHTVESSWS